MKPLQLVVPLRATPDVATSVIGELVVQATPSEGLSAYYRSATHAETEFQPDLFDEDWGYGPSFHQTVLERSGVWFRLPPVPFSEAVWVNAYDLGREPEVRALTAGEVVTFQGSDFVFLGLEQGVVRMRPEEPCDTECEEGEPQAADPSREIRIPVEKLYGATGHLLVDIKYKRGR